MGQELQDHPFHVRVVQLDLVERLHGEQARRALAVEGAAGTPGFAVLGAHRG
jgi:hypothetical protein